jgi:hypothetical protein
LVGFGRPVAKNGVVLFLLQRLPVGGSSLKTTGERLPADRERALLTVGYDAMAHREELVALNVEDAPPSRTKQEW